MPRPRARPTGPPWLRPRGGETVSGHPASRSLSVPSDRRPHTPFSRHRHRDLSREDRAVPARGVRGHAGGRVARGWPRGRDRPDAQEGSGASAHHLRYPVRPPEINPRHTYVVRATVREGLDLRFTTKKAYPVLTHNHGRAAAPAMQQVGVTRPTLRLEQPLAPGPDRRSRGQRGQRSARAVDRARAQVESCDRLGWMQSDLGQLRASRRESPVQQADHHPDGVLRDGHGERVLKVLNETGRYRVRGHVLELMNGNGKFLARLEERNLR